MNARVPAEVFPPGEFLKEELESRGWTQLELAEVLGRPPRVVSEIISGKRGVTPETAKGLAAAFGTSPQFWMNLETSYQLSKTKIEDNTVSRRATLYCAFPVKEMLKRGWIEASENIDVLEQRFVEFFEVSTPDEQPAFAHAAKKTTYDKDSMLQIAWLYRAKQIARALRVAKFSVASLRNAMEQLRGCLEYVDTIRNVPSILGKAGIRLVIVEHLPGAKMDGACFWLDSSSPVVALSLRYDRIDNFWHTLFHELEHVLEGEGKQQPIVETIEPNLAWDSLPNHERKANEAAADYCVRQDEMDGFIARVNPLFTKQQIIGFARRVAVHPGLIVGQLQRRGLIPYSFHREFLEKVRLELIQAALTDGFGNKLSL